MAACGFMGLWAGNSKVIPTAARLRLDGDAVVHKAPIVPVEHRGLNTSAPKQLLLVKHLEIAS